MEQAFQHIDVEQHGEVFVVRLRKQQPEEAAVRSLSDEVDVLIRDQGCRKVVFTLEHLQCMYSVLIARLIKIRRSLAEHEGSLKLCGASAQIMDVFQQCQLHDYFDFAPDVATAVLGFARSPGEPRG